MNFDYDGDGKADIGVWRPSNQFWYIANSSGNHYNSEQQDAIQRTEFGFSDADIPVSGDFDGDSRADFAVRRPATYIQYIKNSSGVDDSRVDGGDGITRKTFGRNASDISVASPVSLWTAPE